MTLSQLDVFVRVAELRSFTATGMRLGISQSAVSHAIKALEQEYGVALLLRQPANLEPTEIGAQLLLKAREILAIAETMRQQAAEVRGLQRGTLRIGSFGPTSSLRLLPRILADYRRNYPDIEVYIDEGQDEQVVQWLQQRQIDVGFVVLPDERFETHLLIEDQMVALVPQDHPLSVQPSLSLAQLCDDPFILTEAGSSGLIMRLFEEARQTPHIRYRSSQLVTTLAMVARGEGLAVVASLALPADEANARPYQVLPLRPVVGRQVGLALAHARQASPAAQAFVKTAVRLRREGRL